MTLAELPLGARARVVAVDSNSSIIHRLMEMGLVRGAPVEVRKVAPFGDPLELKVHDYVLSIRKKEARQFLVEPV